MNQFTTPLHVALVAPYEFELLAPLSYENDLYRITLMPTLHSDGASIPRAFWAHAGCPFGGLYTRSAFLHDALYRSQLFDRARCDELFLEAMKSEGVDDITAFMLYEAVCTFGKESFDARIDVPAYRELVLIEAK
jgi:hypothetical protein